MKSNLLIISLILILQSCSLTKHVPENKYLLVENTTNIHSKNEQSLLITKSEINDIIKQKPNKNIFSFIPFHLGIYNLTDTLKKNWIHKYLRKIGEAPILLNEDLIDKSKGFFKSPNFFPTSFSIICNSFFIRLIKF